jgi:two-component system OmpR family response regulator
VRRILLIEDDEANRLTLSALLEGEGYAVTAAASFMEAERRIRTEAFDVMVLDRGLGGRDGMDLVPIASAATSRPRVVVVSGAGPSAVVPGVDAWFVKGGSISKLVDAIRGTEAENPSPET